MKIILVILMVSILFLNKSNSQTTIVEAHGHLHTEGNKIKDDCGRIVQLKGMSYFWHQWEGSAKYMNIHVMKWLRDDWKAEMVRIPIAVTEGGINCTALGTIKNTVACDGNPESIGKTGKEWAMIVSERAIEAAIEAGIYIIFDWHCHYEYSAKSGAKRSPIPF